MGETEGDTMPRPSEEPEAAPAPEALQVPTQKRRKLKSPTPVSLRGRSATPVRGRSQTPFTLYMTRRSTTPSTWRSITPFLKREEKEKTPFELGRDMRTQITCNKAVFDRALIMDISEPEDIQKPVRYITSDQSVIDRASVMDVSNVEVIYVVEEYEEYEEEEIVEELKPKKKAKPKKSRSTKKEQSPSRSSAERESAGRERSAEREGSADQDEAEESEKKGRRKSGAKKRDKKEKSPSPKLTLKLEIGGGPKANKQMFEEQQQKQQQQKPAAGPKPPPKKSKLVLQMEEQARAAKAAEEEAAKLAAKPKSETYEERQKRLKAEKEEQERLEAERRALEAELRALEAEEGGGEGAAEGTDEEDGDESEEGDGEDDGDSRYEDDGVSDAGDDGASDSRYEEEDEDGHDNEELDELADLPDDGQRRGSDEWEGFTRPDPLEEERWRRIAEEEGEEFMQQMRKYSLAQRKSEKQRDADWQRRREQARLPHFINFLTDRTVEAGQKVRLACAVDGPDLSVKWFKDGRQLERNATHRIINNNNILVLEVLNTTILDSGEYSCAIANANDEVVSSCYVTIYEVFKDDPAPPSFRLIREYYHLRDDELTIECHIHGIPRPVVTWWRDALEIESNFKFTKLEEAHGVYKLLIYKPNSRDSGTYICKATNSSGEAQMSHTVEVAKNRNFHVRGIFHARNQMQQDIEKAARRAMDEALQSKAESDKRRAESGGGRGRVGRASPEPLVSPKQKLQFATQLRDRMALEGTTVRFVCTIIGPNPAARWMKDDKWVVVGPTVRNLSEEGKAILELISVTPESSGVYKCVAKNDHCTIETSCYFKVYSAQADGDEHEPIFALPLKDVYHSSQNDLIIATKVRANPRPTISWLKDNVPVVLDDRIVQIEHLDGVCELIISKPTAKDSGEYSCVADNKLGSQKITHTVVVDVVQSSRRSSALSAMADSESGAEKAPKPPKGKKKDDSDAGGGYERRSRMPEPPPRQQLYFNALLSNRYVAEGSRVKLQAVIGGPNAAIKWQKDDQNVPYGPRIRNMSRDSLAVLEFLNALPEDSGVYTVIAQNEFCKIATSALLHVYQPKISTDVEPIFIRSLIDRYHLNTNELILETGVRGQPPPEVQWFKDSIEIVNEGRHHLQQHPDGTCELIIDNPVAADSGKYVVKAENRAGKMEISHNVLFEGRESHIADNIHGVFHADRTLLRAKHGDADKSSQGGTAAAAAGAESGGDEAKGKRRVRRKSKKDEEENVAVVAASDSAADGGGVKEKRREKVIGIHFATTAKDRVVAEGSKVRISCFLEANEPQVKWFKDEEPIQNGPKIRGRHVEGLCTLEIMSATVGDSGEYKCWARDGTGEASTSCRLEVYASPGSGDVPPTFTRSIKDAYREKLNELQLDVHVRGLPTPTVTWAKDGVRVEPKDRFQQIDHDDGTCELIIMNPGPGDSGKYVCQAENREGKAEIAHMVTVQARSRARPMSPLRAAGPPPKPSEADEKAEKAEKEKKRKKAKNENEEEGGSSGREVPPPPDLRKRIYFRNHLSNRTVKAGSNVRWMVNIDGPEPAARWFHGDQPIVFGPKSKMCCQDGIAWLHLIGVSEEDAGEYTLRVKGSDNEIVSTCSLFVYSDAREELTAPVFTVGIKDTYLLNENELVLDCRVRGKPRPQIQWMKGSDFIVENEKYQQIDQADGYSKLIISNPTEQDSGLYTCVARNEVAEHKITHQVDFGGRERFMLEKTHGFFHRDPNKPHFVAPLGNQTVCGGGTIAISAEFMHTATPIDVQWFRNRQSLAGQPNVRTFMDRGVYTLAIMNATPEVEGTYTCRASNAFGRVESHVNVDVAVGAPKEERPPLFLSRPDTEMKIAVGDPFSISFRIAGDPKPKLIFMKGTKDITKSDRVSKEVSDDYTRFTVHKAQISDSGTYFVVARNNNGTDRIFVTVEVTARARSETPTAPRWGQPLDTFADVSYFRNPPAAISTEPLLVDSGPTHISLSWGKPQSNNSAPVIAYKVEAWMLGHEGGAIWRELGLTPINSFDAFNLKPGVEYHFRVTPKNRYGWGPSVQTSSPLQAGGVECLPEFVKILPGQVKALLDTQFVLECVVHGSPRPEVVWYKDGLQLAGPLMSERVKTRTLGSTCTLTIKQVAEEDAGRYTCEATNAKGRVSTFARLQVVSDPKLFEADSRLKEIVCSEHLSASDDMLPIFTMRLRDRRAQVTYPVRLTCQVVGNPPPQITWYKDDQLLESSRRCLITEADQFYTLELASAALADSGVYTCTAKNELGSVSCHCSLVVDKGIRAYISPEFYVPLDPLYIFPEGQQVRLTAKVEAYPAVGVSWHRNGVRLRPSRRLAASLDSSGFVELVIAEATERDAGLYVCVAANAVGKAESSCRVVIEAADVDEEQRTRPIPAISTSDLPYSEEPLFVVKPRSSEAFEGDTVIIFCEVVGDPKPDVVWLRDFLNPEYYKDAQHFRRIGEGPEYRLEIPCAKLDFTGTYSVIATNCHGQTKAVISLQIYAKDILNQSPMEKGSIRHGNVETLPRFIRHLRNLRCCDGDAITLECHVEGLPEPAIIWEKDGRVLASGKDFVMTYDGIKATLSIPRVYPEDEGEYTCVAKNNIGRTLSSACIIVDVPEEKENMLHRQLSRPSGLFSATSTPLSTPRSTPNRSFSPHRRLSFRHSSIDISDGLSQSRSESQSHFRCHYASRHLISAPKFLAIPHSRVVEEGDSVRFQCAIAGHPTPWATWDKDGMIVTPTTRIAVKEVDDLRFLEIEEVTFDDAGLYRITLENDYGRIEATARLDVIGSSRHSKSPSARSVRASSSRRRAYLYRRIMGPSTAIGGRMALAAGFRGSSVPACKFYHNDEEVRDDNRTQISISTTEAALTITDTTPHDEGVYTCVIEAGDHEPLATSTTVRLLPASTDLQRYHCPPPRIVRPLPETSDAREGDTIDLCFELDSSAPYSYVWTRDDEIVEDCEDFNYIDHGNGVLCLRIHEAFDIDSGRYECRVMTADGFRCSTAGRLIVQRASESETRIGGELILLKSPLPLIAHVESEATFRAQVYPPNASVTWLVCGREVGDDSAPFMLESSDADGVRVLHIQSVSLAHSGEIQLSARHPAESASVLRAYTSLAVIPRNVFSSEPDQQQITAKKAVEPKEEEQVLEVAAERRPASILQGPSDCAALIGGSIRLSVVYEGLPPPRVNWFKASHPIGEAPNIAISTTATRSDLYISDIVADDRGKYTVVVMNDQCSDVAVASVAVEGPPEPPSGRPSISQGPDRVAVAWCGPPYDGGCMITGFIIEMQQLPSPSDCEEGVGAEEGEEAEEAEAPWVVVASVVDSLAFTIKDLQPRATYRFRVRAVNVHGSSEPSLPSECVRVTAPLRVPPEESDVQRPICVRAGGEFRDRFEIIEELGKGRFGVVYKVQEKEQPHQVLAAKVIKCLKARDRTKVQEEISIMQSLKHPKLLQLAASFESAREIVMVTEYITGGELFERVVADDFTLTELDCILFVRQICEGVAYMHSQSIVHLDLKPENIMCNTRTCHQIKIIDFGLAQRLSGSEPVRVLFGTPEFIPPEIISYEPIGFQSDMWSVGVICYVLLSGLSPFMGDTDVETFANITRADYDFDDEAFDCVSQQAKDFISHLLVHRKEDRASADQCLESQWLQKGDDQDLGNKKICTDKLKKFIIRRKWQKTGNAIRALGRMATLSASRRNSAVSASGSLPTSPRPSISGLSMFHLNAAPQMGSLHEEEDNNDDDDDDFRIDLPPADGLRRSAKVLRMRDKSQCSERSDSGYSECSNCSVQGGATVPCHCHAHSHGHGHGHGLQSVARDVTDCGQSEGPVLSVSVPHHLLKVKLEEIARQADGSPVAQSAGPPLDDNHNELSGSQEHHQPRPAEMAEKHNLSPSPPPPPPSATAAATVSPVCAAHIRPSDFTNTIQMRKKSLENSLHRERARAPRSPKPPLYEAPGKVSLLRHKFAAPPLSVSTSKACTPDAAVVGCNVVVVVATAAATAAAIAAATASRDAAETAACPDQTDGPEREQRQQSASLPSSPLSARKQPALRLSSRIREVTDRLAQQQTVSSEARKSPPLRPRNAATSTAVRRRQLWS